MNVEPAERANPALEVASACALGFAVGVALHVLPFLVEYHGPASLIRLVDAAVEGETWWTQLWLLLAGAAFGALLGKRQAVVASVALLAWLPAVAVCEMGQDPTSHNLWPLEFGVYGIQALLALGGAFAALWLKRRLRPSAPRQ